MNLGIPHQDYLLQNDPSEFKEYYQDAKKEIPHKMPRPRGRSVITTEYVDASHG